MNRDLRHLGWAASVMAAAALTGCAQRHGQLAGDPFLESASPGGRVADMASTAQPRAPRHETRTASRHETINRAALTEETASPRKTASTLAARPTASERTVAKGAAEKTGERSTPWTPLVKTNDGPETGFEPDRDSPETGALAAAAPPSAGSGGASSGSKEAAPFPDFEEEAPKPARKPAHPLEMVAASDSRPEAAEPNRATRSTRSDAPNPFETDDESPSTDLAATETQNENPFAADDGATPSPSAERDPSAEAIEPVVAESESRFEAPSSATTRAETHTTAKRTAAAPAPQSSRSSLRLKSNPFADLDGDSDVASDAPSEPERAATKTPIAAARPSRGAASNPFEEEGIPTSESAWKEKDGDVDSPFAASPVDAESSPTPRVSRTTAKPVAADPPAADFDDEPPAEPFRRSASRSPAAARGLAPAERDAQADEQPEARPLESESEQEAEESDETTGRVRLGAKSRDRAITPTSYQFEARPPRKAASTSAPAPNQTPSKPTGWKPRPATPAPATP